MDGPGRKTLICRETCSDRRGEYVAADNEEREASMPLAVSSYELSVFIHVTAVVVGFGATFAEAVMFPIAIKSGTRHLPYLHRLQLAINQYFATPALVIVAGTGIYQMAEGNWSYGDLWVSATITIVVVIAIFNLAFFIPADRKMLPIAEQAIAGSGGKDVQLTDLPEEYQRKARLGSILGPITGLLLVIAIYLMVVKPGL
jgi:uncharacterized membrane protein